MNGNGQMPGGIPLIMGQEERKAAESEFLNHMMFQCYFSLVPVIAAKRLDNDPALGEDANNAQAIAAEAWKIACAALFRATGVKMRLPQQVQAEIDRCTAKLE